MYIFQYPPVKVDKCMSQQDYISGVGDESVESGDPENLSITVGTARLSIVERDIQLLPVWKPSFCTSGSADVGMLLIMFHAYGLAKFLLNSLEFLRHFIWRPRYV